MWCGAVIAATAMGTLTGSAGADAAAPVIVPAPDASQPCGPSANWTTCLLPETGQALVDWPADLSGVWPGPRNFILPKPGLAALWLGETRTDAGFPLIWRDVGSGFPVSPASGPYEFPLAGQYFWECSSVDRCVGQTFFKLKGTMYVIGPRAIAAYRLVSPDNSGTAITYQLDASGSFVVDYTPQSIVEYAFDFEDDGIYDQTSPEPTAQSTFAPGPHTVRVRVKDDKGRYGEWPMFFEVPYIRAGNPEPNPVADTGPGTLNPTGVKFAAAKVRLSVVKRIRFAVLRKRGLSVKVSGLTKGDRIVARLLKGKKTVVASGRASTTGSTKTVRLRASRKGSRILRSEVPTRLVLDVAVAGTDGFTTTKRVAVRIRYT